MKSDKGVVTVSAALAFMIAGCLNAPGAKAETPEGLKSSAAGFARAQGWAEAVKGLPVPVPVDAKAASLPGAFRFEGDDETVQLAWKAVAKRGLDMERMSSFKLLEILFEEGTAPTKKDVMGWFAGRAFFKASEGLPGPSLLAATRDGDGGPLQGSAIALYDTWPNAPDALRDAEKSEIDRVKSELVKRALVPAYGDKEISCEGKEAAYRVRKFGAYLVARGADPGPSSGAVSYGYYFKDVTPPSEAFSPDPARPEDETVQLARRAVAKKGQDMDRISGYKLLEILFEEGAAPTKKDVMGWFEGRAFFHNDQAHPITDLLAAKKLDIDGGLLEGPTIGLAQLDFRPHTLQEVLGSMIGEAKNSILQNGGVPTYGEKELSYIRNGPATRTLIKIRKFGDFLIARNSDVMTDSDVGMYSYYFKDVTPPSERIR